MIRAQGGNANLLLMRGRLPPWIRKGTDGGIAAEDRCRMEI
jgi:hypothetical protein